MKEFEYKIYDCDDRNLNNDTLNEFGREGWNLVTHSTVAIPIDEYGVSGWHYFFFRRPLVTTEENCHDDDGWNYDEDNGLITCGNAILSGSEIKAVHKVENYE